MEILVPQNHTTDYHFEHILPYDRVLLTGFAPKAVDVLEPKVAPPVPKAEVCWPAVLVPNGAAAWHTHGEQKQKN